MSFIRNTYNQQSCCNSVLCNNFTCFWMRWFFSLHRELCLRWYKRAKEKKNKVVGGCFVSSTKFVCVRVYDFSLFSFLSCQPLENERSSSHRKHWPNIIKSCKHYQCWAHASPATVSGDPCWLISALTRNSDSILAAFLSLPCAVKGGLLQFCNIISLHDFVYSSRLRRLLISCSVSGAIRRGLGGVALQKVK